ncbi:MAG: 6-phosphofructokinase, partial [Nitrospira sp.]|nr:6-phosphofructokinase [Nitrospira sp.]
IPIPFKQMVDPATGRTRVRMVEIESQSYQIARQYMIRLNEEDLECHDTVGRYAAVANLPPDVFRDRFKTVL